MNHHHHPEWGGRRSTIHGGPQRHHRPDPAMREGGPMRGHSGRGGRGGGRGRVPRGDVRAAVLLLLAEEPMHGYQLMQTIADRSGGRWTPSPGAIYPTLAQLEDEGLVSVTAEAGRKLATLTAAGRLHVEQNSEGWPDPFATDSGEAPGANLRTLLEELHMAARQVARNGTDAQRASAAEILAAARRSLYLLLADGAQSTPEATDD
jgi:DNA-binding PadR family transcriptional regulator